MNTADTAPARMKFKHRTVRRKRFEIIARRRSAEGATGFAMVLTSQNALGEGW